MSTLLLVANDGGHLMQLSLLSERLEWPDDRMWITVSTPQSESLLSGEQVHWVGPAPTRDWRAAVRNAASIRRVFASHRVGAAVSTGSSLATSALPQAALRRIPAHYIESVTRTESLSLSGRMLQRVPGISLSVQWPHLAHGRWRYRGSVLDGFAATPAPARPVRKLVVSLGTSGTFGFRRILERLVAVVPAGVDVLWQTGVTDTSGLGVDARPALPAAELTAAIEDADVLVAHAGAGIALTALVAGKLPLLIPRLAARGEHIDDHQVEIAKRLSSLGLATVVDADAVTWDDITTVTSTQITRSARPAPFTL